MSFLIKINRQQKGNCGKLKFQPYSTYLPFSDHITTCGIELVHFSPEPLDPILFFFLFFFFFLQKLITRLYRLAPRSPPIVETLRSLVCTILRTRGNSISALVCGPTLGVQHDAQCRGFYKKNFLITEKIFK